MDSSALTNLKMSKSFIDPERYYNIKLKVLTHLQLDCYKTINQLTQLNDIDFSTRNQYLDLMSSYIKPLSFVTKLNLSCPTFNPFRISTPCIRKINNELVCNMRAINYEYTKEGDYISRDDDRLVRTINYIVRLDDNLIVDMFKISEDENLVIHPYHVLGMEDIRLINEKYFLCTRLDVTPSHQPKMCLCEYNRNKTISTKILDYQNMGTEKNWLPLVKEDCKIIYSFHPLIIFDLNLETGVLTPFLTKSISKFNLSTFRGSAVPIYYNEGWLMTIHQVYYHKLRKYYHRFVWLSEDFNTIKISDAFYFDKIGVEFNLGLAEKDDTFILTYSVDDSQPTLLTIDKTTVDNMLNVKNYKMKQNELIPFLSRN